MPKERVSFFKNILTRRMPQILGGYLAASWVVIEFLDWLVKRYPISPHLVEFSLVALASMIPTVLLLAYYHGKPGPDQWNRVEKIGIPTNLVVSAVLLLLLFRGEDLGATTTTVTLMNEQGQKFERTVPKSEFRKNLALFSLDNASGDSSLDWLSHAIPGMVQYDLSQDIYLNIGSTYSYYDDISKAGFPEAVGIPMVLKKKIATEKYMEYFTSGSINSQDGQISIQLSIHDTKTTKILSENLFSGKDIFSMTDETSIWLKNEMKIPKQHIEQTEDLPVSEILTGSLPALKNFYRGMNKITMEGDWIGATKYFEQSVKEDSTFAMAYLQLYICYAFTNQVLKYRQTFEPLMHYLYKLPERMQFAVKHDYYFGIKQDPEMALEVGKNWVELYPDDITAHNILAILYMLRNQKENELSEYKKILSLDPGRYNLLLKIGELYKDMGRMDEALEYFNRYEEKNPNNIKSFIELGNFYCVSGDYELARSNYNKALLIEPDKISVLISLSNIETELGHFGKALAEYDEIVNKCESPEDRKNIYKHLEDYYYLRGQTGKSIEYMELKFDEMAKYLPPFGVLNKKVESLDKYIEAGRTDAAFEIVKTAEEQLGPPLDQMIPYGYFDIYLGLGKIDSAEKALEKAEKAIKTLQLEINRSDIVNAQGRINEQKGEYELAIRSYLKQLDLEPTNARINVSLGRCYRMIKNYKKSEDHLNKALAIHPFWPDANYEMALVYIETGKKEKALELMKRAQYAWEDADPDYEPAKNAREKLAEMENSVI